VTTGTATHVDFLSGTMWLAWMGILLGLGWLLLPNRKRTSIIAAPLMLVAMTAGCGGSGSSSHTTSGTPAGTYTATITAASGSLSHDTTFQVVVQ
jgi:LPXTG-motif cell wall-anchored protein